ncbi:hypothetical protein IT575_02425 [bacterium]|nr:hypothetical protein [bacterium]
MLVPLAWLALLVASVLGFYAGWALPALLNLIEDTPRSSRAGFVWAVLACGHALLASWAIAVIESQSSFSFGFFRWCIQLIILTCIGALACWLSERRSVSWE